jgi:hypothetical protein
MFVDAQRQLAFQRHGMEPFRLFEGGVDQSLRHAVAGQVVKSHLFEGVTQLAAQPLQRAGVARQIRRHVEHRNDAADHLGGSETRNRIVWHGCSCTLRSIVLRASECPTAPPSLAAARARLPARRRQSIFGATEKQCRHLPEQHWPTPVIARSGATKQAPAW